MEKLGTTYFVRTEYDDKEDVWCTYVDALGIATFGDTQIEAMAKTREALIGYLEALEK